MTQKLRQWDADSPSGGESLQYVIVRVQAVEFGVAIGQVQRVLRTMAATRVPRAPEFVEGVINVHGEIIPLVNLKKRLDLTPDSYDEQSRILVVVVDGQVLGMQVDAVTEILRVSPTAFVPPPPIVADVSGVWLTGMTQIGDRLIILLDLSRVLTAQEVAELQSVVSDSEEERGAGWLLPESKSW